MKLIAGIFVFSFLMLQPAYAYIDPGTGSMLFSVVLCSVTTIVFLYNSLALKLKRKIFFKKKFNSTKHDFVIYSEGNQYYSVFKPILDEFEKRNISLTYYTSCEKDYFFNEEYKNIQREYIGNGNKAYFKLAFLNADVCLMTTPQLDVLQLKRSKYVKHYSHIFHSIGYSMDYELFGLDYFDSVLCDANFQIPMIREIEQKRNLPAKILEVVGSTYMDYKKTQMQEKKSTNTILLAPTWGQFGLLKRFGCEILDNFRGLDFNIIIRPHPQSLIVEKNLIDDLVEKYKEEKNISWDFESDNIKSLSQADILISDASCIVLDYAFLFEKPFLYINTDVDFEALDCSDLSDIPWRYKIMDVIGKELKPENGDIFNLKNIIEEMINNKDLKENIARARDYAWENRGKSAQRVADFLIKIQQEVNKDA